MSEQPPDFDLSQKTTDTGTTPVNVPEEKKDRFVRRTLSEKEMSSPAVTQLILDERDRLQVEINELRTRHLDLNRELRQSQAECSTAKTDLAVLKEKLNAVVIVDIIFTIGFGTGVAILGVASTFPVISFAVALVLGVTVVKVVQTIRQVRKR